MSDSYDIWTDPKVWEDFEKAWAQSKEEIFRLQVLPVYRVPDEEEEFKKYLKGEKITLPKGFGDWKKQIAEITGKGTRMINLLIVDSPPSDYIMFSMSVYLETEKVGQKTLMTGRKKASDILGETIDFWMFDHKTVVPMKYDKEGHFIGTGKTVINGEELKRYVDVRDRLMKIALPMREYMKEVDLNKADPVNKRRSISY